MSHLSRKPFGLDTVRKLYEYIVICKHNDKPCEPIGRVMRDATQRYSWYAYDVNGKLLTHPSGRPKHFCTAGDAGWEVFNARLGK